MPADNGAVHTLGDTIGRSAADSSRCGLQAQTVQGISTLPAKHICLQSLRFAGPLHGPTLRPAPNKAVSCHLESKRHQPAMRQHQHAIPIWHNQQLSSQPTFSNVKSNRRMQDCAGAAAGVLKQHHRQLAKQPACKHAAAPASMHACMIHPWAGYQADRPAPKQEQQHTPGKVHAALEGCMLLC